MIFWLHVYVDGTPNELLCKCYDISYFRLLHTPSGRTYHETFCPPKVCMKDDVSVIDIVLYCYAFLCDE